MTTERDDGDRIEGGDGSPETDRRLREAHRAAEEADRRVRAELESRQARRRGFRIGWALVIGGVVMALGAIALVVLAPDGVQEPRPAPTTIDDPEAVIAELRDPTGSDEYRRLARAYEARHERTGSPTDLERAAQAEVRADRLERRNTMKAAPIVFAIALALIVLAALAGGFMWSYNGLATRDERVDERWAQVETVLQRRLDLVPQLVESVRGYAEHERETLTAVTEARARALESLEETRGEAPAGEETARRVSEAQAEVSAGLRGLLAVAERYPELEASGNFLALQDQLEGTENRIAVERQRYNDAVRAFNQKTRTFPSNLVAAAFGFESRQYFQSRLGAEDAVPVSFDES